MRRHIAVAFTLCAVVICAPREAAAQWRIGAGLGYEFDLKDDWLHLGAEARYVVPAKHLEVNPRILYNSGSNYSVTQVDVNLLYDLDLVTTKRVVPYAGGGVLMQRLSIDAQGAQGTSSETKVGINLVAGARLNTKGAFAPFATLAYSIIQEQGNNMVLFAGIHWVPGK